MVRSLPCERRLAASGSPPSRASLRLARAGCSTFWPPRTSRCRYRSRSISVSTATSSRSRWAYRSWPAPARPDAGLQHQRDRELRNDQGVATGTDRAGRPPRSRSGGTGEVRPRSRPTRRPSTRGACSTTRSAAGRRSRHPRSTTAARPPAPRSPCRLRSRTLATETPRPPPCATSGRRTPPSPRPTPKKTPTR